MTLVSRAMISGFRLGLVSAAVGMVSASPAAAAGALPFQLAQIDIPPAAGSEAAPPSLPAPESDPVAIAEKAVEDARAALRNEMATGGDVRGARRDLQAAIRHLNQVKEMADSGQESPENGDAEAAEAPAESEADTASETPPDAPPTLALPAPPEVAPPPLLPVAPTPEPQTETAQEPPPATVQPAEPSAPVLAEPPTLPAPGTPLATVEEPSTPPSPPSPEPETAATEPPADGPADAGQTDEKPGFFRRLFGSDDDTAEPETDTAKPEEAEKEAPEPSLPIFEKLPPLAGPKVVSAGPGEAEIVKQDDDKRLIVREGSRLTVKHDDNDRFRRKGEEIKVENGQGGTTITTVTRANGTEVVTVRDPSGDILQRYRKKQNGEVEMLIGDRDRDGKPLESPGESPRREPDRRFDFSRTLPKLVVPIPPNQYVLASRGASRSQIEQALVAPPVEAIERPYSLEEIRRSERLRAKLRRIDIDTVNFEFGATTVAEDQIPNLQAIGNALADIVATDPNEVFYVEGHTDAVGSNLSNLALSDKRAESIAEILTFYFNIPPENLVTQGYGEQYLKVLTAGPERLNRRASVRRITPLLVGKSLATAR